MQQEANRAPDEKDIQKSAQEDKSDPMLIKRIEEAQRTYRQTSLEQAWLMRHLHVTNEAIVPVLNVTRLKAIKGSPFSNE